MQIPTSPFAAPSDRCSPSRSISRAVKREGWQSQHILVVSKDNRRLDIAERQFIRRLGERLYGAKEKRHG